MTHAAVAHAIVAALTGSRPGITSHGLVGTDLAVPEWTVIAAAVAAGMAFLVVGLAWWRRPRRSAVDPAEAEAIAAALERRALRQGRILPDADDAEGSTARQEGDEGAGRER